MAKKIKFTAIEDLQDQPRKITMEQYLWDIVNRLVDQIWAHPAYLAGGAVYLAINRLAPGAIDQFKAVSELEECPAGYDFMQWRTLYPVSRSITKEQLGREIRKAIYTEPVLVPGMEFSRITNPR